MASDCGDAGLGKSSDSCGAANPASAAGMPVSEDVALALNTTDGGDELDCVSVAGVLVDVEVVLPTAEQPGGVAVACQLVPAL